MSVSSTPRRTINIPFNDHTRIEGLDAQAGTGRTRIADLPELTNHIGTVHGGALFTVGEAASGRAFISALGMSAMNLVPVVKTATIRFLKIAKGEINATGVLLTPIEQVIAAVEKSSRATAEVKVTLRNVEGVAVAEMDVEWHVRRSANP